MKLLLLLGVTVAVLFGLTKLRSKQSGADVWHEATQH
ncbi:MULTISPECIES: DLW-39 family protein [Antrihabitans]|jgi:hypothetical protein|uniref:DLW-39 family protein n=1 Tax=Antrihabitans spumae TaxID=3373370 RepID=A0ABW7KPH1_9NOCA|nr:DLW-39 family protein [Antrihabitans stalagmiti]